MIHLVIALIALDSSANGLLAGLTMDTSQVTVPACRCIGAMAYAVFVLGNDPGTALFYDPLERMPALLLTVHARVQASAELSSREVLLLICCFARESVERVITRESQEEDIV